jgi:glycerophosphoryl diester phosphodiesterase
MVLTSKILPIVQEIIERKATVKAAASNNPLLKQIAHRGYRATGAPQCTAPAYITAKQVGYDAGENDLWVTKDGVFVMAHNTTMPSDGKTVIAENTYETLLNCNMGKFNGKTIPIMTLEEWLILMKKIGLEAYIDLKSTFTEETAAAAVAIVRKHGMLDKVTWSGSVSKLTLIRKFDPTARIAFLSTTAFADTFITETLKPFVIEGKPNLTVVNTQSKYVTAKYVEAVYNAGLGIECWHCDYSAYGFETEEEILAEIERVVNLGVTGICLDTYLPCEYFINKLNEEWGL